VEPVGMDFGQAVQSASAINQWVVEQTNNKIKKIITPESLGPLTKLVLVNAIYFKGDWDVKFDKSKTSKGDFHVSPTKTVKTDMMFCNDEYG
jgi:serpin B